MRTWIIVAVSLLICISGCTSLESKCEDEKEIPLSEISVLAVDAAQQAVEGIALTEAEVEKEGRTVYVLEGTANGKKYEIEVTAGGKILEVEQESMFDDMFDDDD